MAGQMSLQAGITATDTIINVDSVVGLPATTPYTLALDFGADVEELVSVTSVSGTNLTVVRGIDGTAAGPHNTGAIVVHTTSAQDFREPQQHIYLTEGAHGVTGALVGATDVQTLDNKTFVSTSGTDAPLKVRPKAGQSGAIFKVQNTTGTSDLATIDNTGRVSTPGVTGSSSSTFTAGSSATTALVARGASGQVAAIVSVKNAGGTDVATIAATGDVACGSVTSAGNVSAVGTVSAGGALSGKTASITSDTPATATLSVRGAASQSAKLQEWKNSSGTVLASVGPNGAAEFATVTAANIPKIYTGTLSASIPALSSATTGLVTFPNAFGSAPAVFLTLKSDATLQTTFRTGTVTASNFTAVLRNDRPDSVTVELNWLAIGA